MVEKVEKLEEEEEGGGYARKGDRLFTADMHSRGKQRKREKTRAADFRRILFSPPFLPLPPVNPTSYLPTPPPPGFIRRMTDGARYWINNALITLRRHEQRGGGGAGAV